MLAQMGITHSSVLQLVVTQLAPGGATCLRQVDRSMRVAINRMASRVELGLASAHPSRELALVFPEATELCISFRGNIQVSSADTCLFLEHVLSTTPALVSQARKLELLLSCDLGDDGVYASVAAFLSR
jgi:hypothetical protein